MHAVVTSKAKVPRSICFCFSDGWRCESRQNHDNNLNELAATTVCHGLAAAAQLNTVGNTAM